MTGVHWRSGFSSLGAKLGAQQAIASITEALGPQPATLTVWNDSGQLEMDIRTHASASTLWAPRRTMPPAQDGLGEYQTMFDLVYFEAVAPVVGPKVSTPDAWPSRAMPVGRAVAA